MINYTCGMSKDIIYDFGEIEWILRNKISCLPLIDINNIKFFNYQFELYDENMSLINDIRIRFEQKLIDDVHKKMIEREISSLNNDQILQLFNSIEYILSYLRNVNNKNIIKTSTIQKFIDEYVHPKTFIDNTITYKSISSIYLENITDLYELLEEHIFDKILRDNIGSALSGTNN